MSRFRLASPVVLLACLMLAGQARSADQSGYTDGKEGAAELKHVNGVPVLTVQGTPEEMGKQTALLTAKALQKLFNFPKELVKKEGAEAFWPILIATAKSMEPQ